MDSSILDDQARPGESKSAQVHAAGLVRILCVVREGAYETLHLISKMIQPPESLRAGTDAWCMQLGQAAAGWLAD